jgi:cysteine desulfurase / selenocysteine lyase
MTTTLYFDNASTSWPKPKEVVAAIVNSLEAVRGNPGRTAGGHGGGQLISETREAISGMFGISDPHRVIFTHNATGALNLAIQGYLEPGDHVVASSMEHNAVARPLNALRKHRNVTYEVLEASPEGFLDPEDLRRALGKKKAKLVAISHASNVSGSVQDLRALGAVVHEAGARLLVDGSQSAGVVPIDVQRDHIDMLGCPGHKNLLGPAGTGFCYISPELEVSPILYGGTGSLSDLECMPEQLPERYEPGTLNFHGLAGLKAGIEYIQGIGVEEINRRETATMELLFEGIRDTRPLRLHGPSTARNRLPVFSFTVPGHDPAVLGRTLSEEFGIVLRVGLHCSPWAHQTLGTYPQGTARVSTGLFHTADDVATLVSCLREAVRRTMG